MANSVASIDFIPDEIDFVPDEEQIDFIPDRTLPGESPTTPIDSEHPEMPFGGRWLLKNLAGSDDQTGVRTLAEWGFEAVPRGPTNYSLRKGDGPWYVLDPSSVELKDFTTDIMGDVAKGIGTTVGAAKGLVLGAPTGPGAIASAGVGGMAGSALTEAGLMAAGRALGVRPTLGEVAGSAAREGALGGVFGAGGQAVSQAARALRPGVEKFARGVQVGRQPTPSGLRGYRTERAREALEALPPRERFTADWVTRQGQRRIYEGQRAPLKARTSLETIERFRDAPTRSIQQKAMERGLGPEAREMSRQDVLRWLAENQPGYIKGAPGGSPVPQAGTVRFQAFGRGYERGFRQIDPATLRALTTARGTFEPAARTGAMRLGQGIRRAGRGIGRAGQLLQVPFRGTAELLRAAGTVTGRGLPGILARRLEGPMAPALAAALGPGPMVRTMGVGALAGQALSAVGKAIAGDTTGASIRSLMMHPRIPAVARTMLERMLQNPSMRRTMSYVLLKDPAFRAFLNSEYQGQG